MPPKAPQDRKPKAKAIAAEAEQAEFKFEHDGETYLLPNATPYMSSTSGGEFMDAMLDPGSGDVRLAMIALNNAREDVDPDAWEALRSKSMENFLEVTGEWLSAATGVELGKSSSSSS